MKFSLGNFLVVCFALLFSVLYIYQKHKCERLEKQVAAILEPLKVEIESLKFSIQKRELALAYSKQMIRSAMGQAKLEFNENMSPVGFRRELSNIRNAQLRLKREQKKLESLQEQLDDLLHGT